MMIRLVLILFPLVYISLGVALVRHRNDLALPKPLAYALLVLMIVGFLLLSYVTLFLVLFGYNS